MDGNPFPIDYATPASIASPDYHWRKSSALLSCIAASIGVAILLLYAITRWDLLTIAGLFWLFIGGILTLGALAGGVSYAFVAYRGHFPPPSTRVRACAAVLLPLATFVIAVACVMAGSILRKRFNGD